MATEADTVPGRTHPDGETVDSTDVDDAAEPSVPRVALIVLCVWVVLRLALPAKLVIAPLGQVGSPATLWGLGCLLWYLYSLLWRGSGVHRGRQPIRWAFALVVMAWLLSYSMLPMRLPEGFERNGADAALIQMLSMVGVGLLAADGLENRRQLATLARWVCMVWCFSSIVAVIQFMGYDLAEWITRIPGLKIVGGLGSVEARGSFNRAAGTTSHPLEFATITAMILPLALQLAPSAKNPRRWNVLVLAIAMGVPVSMSRSGFIGLAIGLLVVGLSWPSARRRRTLLYGVALVVVIFATVPGFLGTLTGMFTQASSDSSITTRTDDYAAVQPLIEERPLFGRGIGTFTPPRYRILDNQYLVTLIEGGGVGLAALLGFVVISAITAHLAWSGSPPGENREIARGLLAGVLVAGVSMAFFDALTFHAFSGTAFLLAGMGGACWRLAGRREGGPVSEIAVGTGR